MNVNDFDQQRIAGRKWAEEVLVALQGETASYRRGFMRRIKREFGTRELSPSAMTDERARKFGNETVEFGKHRGDRYDDVPLDYLEWLADRGIELLAYLESRRIREERRDRDE